MFKDFLKETQHWINYRFERIVVVIRRFRVSKSDEQFGRKWVQNDILIIVIKTEGLS